MRKPSSAVEKAAPGANRILCGMIADTLALSQNDDADALYQKFRDNHFFGRYDYARSLLRRAAEMAHPAAMYDCGMDYMSGDGFPQDNKQAIYWIRKAAEQGHTDAQRYMGWFYREAHVGMPFFQPDISEAYKWFTLAADQGKDVLGQKYLERLLPTMTPEQLQEGERRLQEFNAQKKQRK